MGVYALLFFFAAGEEILWGQRIFGREAGEFFTARSERAETNIHNMKIGEYNLNKVIFGNILTVVIALVDLQRKWEVYELIFALTALSISLYPQNAAECPCLCPHGCGDAPGRRGTLVRRLMRGAAWDTRLSSHP